MTIYGSPGNDILTGTDQRDDMTAREGDDILSGLGGNDDLYGGAGNDRLDGGAGNDALRGGEGNDTFVASTGQDSIEGFQTGDLIQLSGFASFADVLAASSMAERGDSTLIDLGGGNSLLLEDVRLSQLTGSMFGFAGGSEPPVATGPIIGTARADDILGTAGADRIEGRAGNDDLKGAVGDDTILGEGGADDLYGSDGNDMLNGGRGNDDLRGGLGNDTFVFSSGRDDIEDFTTGDRILIEGLGITSFDQLSALMTAVGGGDDTLITFSAANRLRIEDVRPGELTASDFIFA